MVRYDNYRVYFSGDNFPAMLKEVKKHGLKWDANHKAWTGAYEDCQKALFALRILDSAKPAPDKWTPDYSGVSFDSNKLTHEPLGQYQLDDIQFLTRYKKTLNFNEVGLGKTYETIETINHLDIDLLVIVTVTEAVYNWKRELKLFGHYTDDDILIVDRELAHTKVFESGKRVIIMDYHKVRTLTKEYSAVELKKLTKAVWQIPVKPARSCIVLDESHSIKNRESLQTRCLHAHKDLFDYKFLLTATPHPNGIDELWSQLYFWDENFIGKSYIDFLRGIAKIGTPFSKTAINYYYKDKVEMFLNKIRPYCLRRTKKECLPNLPEQIIQKVYVEPTERQLAIYNAVATDYVQKHTDNEGLEKVEMDFPYLVLAASEPSLLQGRLEFKEHDKLVSGWKFHENSKLAMCKELVKKHTGEKIIIWSTHPHTCELLAQEFGAFVMHGQTHIPSGVDRAQYRDKLIEDFKTATDKNIAVFNPQVMGTGVNMQFASVNIYWDRSFDVKVYLQSLGRTHRANSTRESLVYVLILDKTLEVYQDARLDSKRGLNDEALNKNFSMKRLQSALAGKIF